MEVNGRLGIDKVKNLKLNEGGMPVLRVALRPALAGVAPRWNPCRDSFPLGIVSGGVAHFVRSTTG